MNRFDPIKVIGGALFGLLVFVIFLSTYFTVGQNERVVVSNWGEFSYIAEPGLHFKMPFRTTTTAYPIGIQSMWSGKEWVNTYTVDNQEVDVSYTIFFRIPANQIEYIYTNNRDYDARLQSMAVDRMKAAMGQVNVQLVAEKRGELRDSIKATLKRDAAPMGIEVTDFQLTDLQYTKSFREAVNNAAVAKAGIESREYERQQAEKVAQTAKVAAIGRADAAREDARGVADARVLAATAEAKSIQLQGEATAAAMDAQAKALKDQPALVEMEKARRWQGQVPTSMYAGTPIPFVTAK